MVADGDRRGGETALTADVGPREGVCVCGCRPSDTELTPTAPGPEGFSVDVGTCARCLEDYIGRPDGLGSRTLARFALVGKGQLSRGVRPPPTMQTTRPETAGPSYDVSADCAEECRRKGASRDARAADQLSDFCYSSRRPAWALLAPAGRTSAL